LLKSLMDSSERYDWDTWEEKGDLQLRLLTLLVLVAVLKHTGLLNPLLSGQLYDPLKIVLVKYFKLCVLYRSCEHNSILEIFRLTFALRRRLLNIKAVKDQVKQQTGLEEPVPSTSIEEGDSRRRHDEEDGDDGDTSDDGMRSYYHGKI
jgi:hypothetical protein